MIGRFEAKNGSKFLYEPKLYIFNGKTHGILSLPGDPDVICIDNMTLGYELPAGEAYDLYVKSVSVIDVPQSDIVVVS